VAIERAPPDPNADIGAPNTHVAPSLEKAARAGGLIATTAHPDFRGGERLLHQLGVFGSISLNRLKK
jgi:hypothetical protein